jgi:arginyl-tRNA synthetase
MEQMTSFEGDTGPYLQYAHARICSIERKAGLSAEDLNSADLSLLTEPSAINVVRLLAQYPDVVQNVLKTYEPTNILTYLFKMTHVLSGSYEQLRIVGSETEVMKARMALYDAARTVLANGMRLLGLNPVDRYALPSHPCLPEFYFVQELCANLCLVGCDQNDAKGFDELGGINHGFNDRDGSSNRRRQTREMKALSFSYQPASHTLNEEWRRELESIKQRPLAILMGGRGQV